MERKGQGTGQKNVKKLNLGANLEDEKNVLACTKIKKFLLSTESYTRILSA